MRFRNHKLNDNEQKSCQCEYCQKTFTDQTSLTEHMGTHARRATYSPNIYKKRSTEKNDRKILATTKRGHQVASYKHCQKTGKDRRKPGNHLCSHSTANNCSVCGRDSHWRCRSKLLTHKRTNTKSYQCDVCKAPFSTKRHLAIHGRTHINEKPFICGSNQRGFAHKSNFKAHAKIHMDKKRNYKCTDCCRIYSRKGSVEFHKSMHKRKKLHKSNNCEVEGTTKTKGRIEIKSKTDEKRKSLQCTECSELFTEKVDLVIHVLSHKKEGPFSCSICAKTFANFANLKRHTYRHVGRNPYSCDRCHLEFRYASLLNDHLRIHRRSNSTADQKDFIRRYLEDHDSTNKTRQYETLRSQSGPGMSRSGQSDRKSESTTDLCVSSCQTSSVSYEVSQSVAGYERSGPGSTHRVTELKSDYLSSVLGSPCDTPASGSADERSSRLRSDSLESNTANGQGTSIYRNLPQGLNVEISPDGAERFSRVPEQSLPGSNPMIEVFSSDSNHKFSMSGKAVAAATSRSKANNAVSHMGIEDKSPRSLFCNLSSQIRETSNLDLNRDTQGTRKGIFFSIKGPNITQSSSEMANIFDVLFLIGSCSELSTTEQEISELFRKHPTLRSESGQDQSDSVTYDNISGKGFNLEKSNTSLNSDMSGTRTYFNVSDSNKKGIISEFDTSEGVPISGVDRWSALGCGIKGPSSTSVHEMSQFLQPLLVLGSCTEKIWSCNDYKANDSLNNQDNANSSTCHETLGLDNGISKTYHTMSRLEITNETPPSWSGYDIAAPPEGEKMSGFQTEHNMPKSESGIETSGWRRDDDMSKPHLDQKTPGSQFSNSLLRTLLCDDMFGSAFETELSGFRVNGTFSDSIHEQNSTGSSCRIGQNNISQHIKPSDEYSNTNYLHNESGYAFSCKTDIDETQKPMRQPSVIPNEGNAYIPFSLDELHVKSSGSPTMYRQNILNVSQNYPPN